MAKKRPADFDVRQAVDDPGFTPRASDASALLDLAAEASEKEKARAAERALLRLGAAAAEPAIDRARGGAPAEKAAALRFLGRLAGEASAASERDGIGEALLGALGHEDARARRAAAGALGKARPAGVDEALSRALEGETDASVRRALLEALGKIGSEAAARAIAAAGDDPATARERSRAALMAARGEARATPSSIETARAPEGPVEVALYCRAGLEEVLRDELPASLGARIVADPPGGARVSVTLRGPLAELHERSRTFVDLTFPLPPVRFAGEDPEAAILAALTSDAARAVMRRFTSGPLRFRVAFRGGGKRRAAVWKLAAEVAARAPELINDPTESPWEARVFEGLGIVRVELAPAIADPRFGYRLGDVPAASHPTIAAALARVAGVRDDDVVWDPFVGSGTELCERAKAGAYWRLVGSDIDPRALAVARKNLAAAGVRDALLIEGDATKVSLSGAPPTLILSNPPLGRRVQRSSALGPMLDRFVAHAANELAPGGRLVWMSPFPERTAEMAAQKGLRLARSHTVDMGGFSAELQVLVKPRRR